jgi:hypothetical protein
MLCVGQQCLLVVCAISLSMRGGAITLARSEARGKLSGMLSGCRCGMLCEYVLVWTLVVVCFVEGGLVRNTKLSRLASGTWPHGTDH